MAKRVDRFSEVLLRGLTKVFGSRIRKDQQINKNAPCPCGSGLKYKRCCMGKSKASARRA